MKYCKIILLVFAALLLSCSTGKRKPLVQLEELTEEIREHHKEYSTADWKDAYARYEQIAADMERYQYTKEEAKKIGELEGECVGYFMKDAVNSLEGFESEVKGFLDGLSKTIEK